RTRGPSGGLARLGAEALVEALILGRHVPQQLVGAEAFAIGVGQAIGFLDELLGSPEEVDVADGAARIRGKAPGQDRADVGVPGIGDHAFLEAARDLDALAHEKALGQLLLQFRRALLHLHFDALGEARPDPRRLAVFDVLVIALGALAPDAALVLDDPRQ